MMQSNSSQVRILPRKLYTINTLSEGSYNTHSFGIVLPTAAQSEH